MDHPMDSTHRSNGHQRLGYGVCPYGSLGPQSQFGYHTQHSLPFGYPQSNGQYTAPPFPHNAVPWNSQAGQTQLPSYQSLSSGLPAYGNAALASGRASELANFDSFIDQSQDPFEHRQFQDRLDMTPNIASSTLSGPDFRAHREEVVIPNNSLTATHGPSHHTLSLSSFDQSETLPRDESTFEGRSLTDFRGSRNDVPYGAQSSRRSHHARQANQAGQQTRHTIPGLPENGPFAGPQLPLPVQGFGVQQPRSPLPLPPRLMSQGYLSPHTQYQAPGEQYQMLGGHTPTVLGSPSRSSGQDLRRAIFAEQMAGSSSEEDDVIEDEQEAFHGHALFLGAEYGRGHQRQGLRTGTHPPSAYSLGDESQFLERARAARRALHSSAKLVASAATLASFESVQKESLKSEDQTCIICYNEFGIKNPDGHIEAPVRLPKCKHLFGDHCLKQWLKDSDSCPYCRDKLEAEPKGPAPLGMRHFLHATDFPGGLDNTHWLFMNNVREQDAATVRTHRRRSQDTRHMLRQQVDQTVGQRAGELPLPLSSHETATNQLEHETSPESRHRARGRLVDTRTGFGSGPSRAAVLSRAITRAGRTSNPNVAGVAHVVTRSPSNSAAPAQQSSDLSLAQENTTVHRDRAGSILSSPTSMYPDPLISTGSSNAPDRDPSHLPWSVNNDYYALRTTRASQPQPQGHTRWSSSEFRIGSAPSLPHSTTFHASAQLATSVTDGALTLTHSPASRAPYSRFNNNHAW